MTSELFDALGFRWDRSAVAEVGVHTVTRAVWRYQRSLPTFVWDAAVLEGNPFTYPEVQTLMDGVTVGGRKVSDAEQVLNLADAAAELVRMVKSGEFALIFERGTSAILGLIGGPFEQAIAYFLFAALQQFYFDGNKRTGRWMMNGHLMAHGIDAISVPAPRRSEFNTLMVGLFHDKDATPMFAFLASCHPDLDPEPRY